MIINLKISKEQRRVLLLKWPSIKFFIQKAIIDYTDKVTIEEEQFNIDEELRLYHDRCVLNGYDIHKRKMTQETKDKISKAQKGKHTGWHQFPETRRLIGLANKGKIRSKETREKISKANKGKKRTAEQRRRMSLGHIGLKRKGRKLSEEHKKKIGLSHKGMTYKKRKVKIK